MSLIYDSEFSKIDNEELMQLVLQWEELTPQVELIRRSIERIQSSCDHECRKIHGMSSVCKHCGKYCGWYCPKSKNHICDYESEHYGCKYCGIGSERK